MRTPFPGVDFIVKVPPAWRTRSSMLINPSPRFLDRDGSNPRPESLMLSTIEPFLPPPTETAALRAPECLATWSAAPSAIWFISALPTQDSRAV